MLRRLFRHNILTQFGENPQVSNVMKIRFVGAELLHAGRQAEGQTDRHEEADSRVLQFCERA